MDVDDVPIRMESVTPPPLFFDHEMRSRSPLSPQVQIRQESVTPPPLYFNDEVPPASHLGKRKEREDETSERVGDPDDEEWEAELDESLAPGTSEIRDWLMLRAQIKADLKKKAKSLPLSQINQLMIVRNFATLRLKGLGRIVASKEIARQWHDKLDGSSDHFAHHIQALAWHYQFFEQLPKERRGGFKNSRSILKSETVRNAAHAWLFQQGKGKVTPIKFKHGLSNIILPSLGIFPSKPLCERTARRWLVKLGWQCTTIKKGVYLDGHERPDVVKYCQEDFLPQMLEYEHRMACYELVGNDLLCVAPTLQPDEKELIPEFHDESSFHAFEHTGSVWYVIHCSFINKKTATRYRLHSTEQIMPKKSRGHLIHASEFIEPENGHLVVFGKDGEVIKEAQQIMGIYKSNSGMVDID